MTDTAKATGVQDLINRLRDDGVKAGREEADKLLQDARKEAVQIVEQAKAEAAEMLDKTRAEIDSERTSALESLRLAIRDTELKMEAELKATFAAHVTRLVSMEMRDVKFLRRLILAIAGVAAGDKAAGGQPVELLLPADLFETDEEGTRFTDKGREYQQRLVLGISGEMLREGVDLKPSDSIGGGIRVRLVGEDLEIDLSDKAISELLLQTILPRYRTLVSGTA